MKIKLIVIKVLVLGLASVLLTGTALAVDDATVEQMGFRGSILSQNSSCKSINTLLTCDGNRYRDFLLISYPK
jgi:hypothetical protein